MNRISFSTIKKKLSELIVYFPKDKWIIGQLILGFILIFLFWLFPKEFFQLEGRFFIFLIYCFITGIFFLSSEEIKLNLVILIVLGFIFRLLILYHGINSPHSFVQSEDFLIQQLPGYFFIKSLEYVTVLFPLFEIGTFFLEGVFVYFILLIFQKHRIRRSILVLYLWNPFVIVNLYYYWNPFLVWSLLIVLCIVLLINDRTFWASIVLGCSLGFNNISLLVLFLMYKELKHFAWITLLLYIGIFLIPGNIEFLTSQIIYSKWLQETISHFERGFSLWDIWIMFLISFFVSIIVWGMLSQRKYLEKIYWVFFIFVLIYPNFFSEMSILMILFGAIFRNMSLLILSAYLFVKPAFGWLNFSGNDLYWQYGILVLFFAVSQYDQLKKIGKRYLIK